MRNKSVYLIIIIALYLSKLFINASEKKYTEEEKGRFSYSSTFLTADIWDKLRERGLKPGQKYTISSGTGFFVNSNYIVTNEHVVQNCLNIVVRGAVPPNIASLYATDSTIDLAILKTQATPEFSAHLRSNLRDLKIGENLLVIGYPLASAEDGKYIYTKASIENIFVKGENITEIEFIASIDHGNSGGPLIDSSGNIIGVIQARKSYYIDADNDPTTIEKPFKVTGVAIGSSILQAFLAKNDITYNLNYSYNILTNYNLHKVAEHYVVNIHCIKK